MDMTLAELQEQFSEHTHTFAGFEKAPCGHLVIVLSSKVYPDRTFVHTDGPTFCYIEVIHELWISEPSTVVHAALERLAHKCHRITSERITYANRYVTTS